VSVPTGCWAVITAENPGPFTLQGTNTWLVGADPCWIVDPGPLIESHLERVFDGAHRRGGIGGIALTHDHPDHADAAVALRARAGGVPLAAARFAAADLRLRDGDAFGPFTAVATPGHAPDHLAFMAGDTCFSGDAVLGWGSVFVAPDPGALRGYLAGLERLQALAPATICPGHGPVVTDPAAKLAEYLAHRREREARLVAALGDGLRSPEELLDRVWDDVPVALRPAAAVTLAAHLDKLAEEGRLPTGVERPG
jgi:glyoxylase-like metal-dependent hydrolase (beta-lactamase superfamily II)